MSAVAAETQQAAKIGDQKAGKNSNSTSQSAVREVVLSTGQRDEH